MVEKLILKYKALLHRLSLACVWALVSIFALLLPTSMLSAQPFNGSGIADREIHRQQEAERQRLQDIEDARPDVHFQTEATEDSRATYPVGEVPCLIIDEIMLEGNDADKFQWALKAVDDAKGLCLGSQGLNILMSQVQNKIIEKGFVTTRIVAIPQDLTTGRFTLMVIPGRVTDIKLSTDSARGFYPYIILDTAMPVSSGDILNIRDIEQGLENLRRLPTVTTDMQIVPGDEEGESELVIAWKQGIPFRVALSADDSGSQYTGLYQGNVTFTWDNPLGLGDMFSVSLNRNLEHPKPYGTRGYSFYYSVPVGYWQFTYNTSQYNYHQEVVGSSVNYEYSGTSRNTLLEVSRVLHRGTRSKTSASFGGFINTSKNFIDETEIEIQRRRMGGWNASINHLHYLGALTLDTNMRFHRGTGVFDSIPAPEEALDEGTSRPSILYLDLRAQYPFEIGGLNLDYSGHWRQQWAFDRLVAPDRLNIGGRYTVRGYTGDFSLSADNGFVFRNELSLALGETNQELYAGLDFGRVWGPFDNHLLGQSLSGATLGLRGTIKGFYYDVFASTPVNRPDNFPGEELVTGFNVIWQF